MCATRHWVNSGNAITIRRMHFFHWNWIQKGNWSSFVVIEGMKKKMKTKNKNHIFAFCSSNRCKHIIRTHAKRWPLKLAHRSIYCVSGVAHRHHFHCHVWNANQNICARPTTIFQCKANLWGEIARKSNFISEIANSTNNSKQNVAINALKTRICSFGVFGGCQCLAQDIQKYQIQTPNKLLHIVVEIFPSLNTISLNEM